MIEQADEDVGDRAPEQPEARGTDQQPLCIGPLEPEVTVTQQQTTEEQRSSAVNFSTDILQLVTEQLIK
jgi:hypothetical protein